MTTANKTETKTPKFGRAFEAVCDTDWAILPDKLTAIAEVAARVNDVEAFRAEQSEKQERDNDRRENMGAVAAEPAQPLENTRYAMVRDGVAIIPVRGTIMRYGSWFSEYSGGTSIAALARDFNVALNNPNVHAILFDIDSPGGEVTGVHEFAQMIFAGSKRKPVTAYTGGMLCSAAVWIGLACSDVVADKTARCGSVGVMAVYTDDRKWQEKVGLLDIEIVSDQSPYKNVPPTEDDGLKRIRARLTALCQIFASDLAEFRQVTVDKVLSDFGKGDVMLAEAAIQAGMIDRLGSFEETLAELAETHTPGYQRSSYSAAATSTLISAADLGSSLLQTEPDNTVSAQPANVSEKTAPEDDSDEPEETEDKKKKEDNMNTNTPGAITAAETDKQNPAPAVATSAAANVPAVIEAAAAAASATDSAADLNRVSELERALAEANAKLKAKDDEIAKAALEARDKRLGEIAKTLPGEFAAQEAFLKDIATAFGEDSAQFKTYVETQTAIQNQLETGTLFSESGVAGANSNSSDNAEQRLDQMAKERAKKDGSTFEQAYSKVLQENPALYSQYEAEQQKGRSAE